MVFQVRILFNVITHKMEIISTLSIDYLLYFSILSVFFTDISCFDYGNLRELHHYFYITISYCPQMFTFNLLFVIFKYGYVYSILPFPVTLVMKISLHCFHEIHVLAQLYFYPQLLLLLLHIITTHYLNTQPHHLHTPTITCLYSVCTYT